MKSVKAIVFAIPSGWGSSALVNTVTIFLVFLVLLGFLSFGATLTGGFNGGFAFYTGPCQDATKINIALHLVLNLVGTFILASSNMFMQVLNAPTRRELDMAHAQQKQLDIGVSSYKNLFYVSRFKAICWGGFLLSSIPVHLFLNSIIFETDTLESDFHLTIGRESFVNGGTYYPPGASLWNIDVPIDCTNNSTDANDNSYSGKNCTGQNSSYVWWEDYTTSDSPVMKNLTETAAQARDWVRISATECRSQFLFCSGLRDYGNVMVIVEAGKNGSVSEEGWTRNEVFNLTAEDAAFWDTLIPAEGLNALWYSDQCSMTANIADGTCWNDCATYLGYEDDGAWMPYTGPSTEGMESGGNKPDTWSFQFYNQNARQLTFWNRTFPSEMRSGFNYSVDDMDVSYCLAQARNPQCSVCCAIAPLFIVTIFVLVKTVQCVIAYRGLVKENSLVTLGDAMDSFIRCPDPATFGMCTLSNIDFGFPEVGKAQSTTRRRGPLARRWKPVKRFPRGSATNAWTWLATYFLLWLILGLMGYFLSVSNPSISQISFTATNNHFIAQDGASGSYGRSFLPAILLANLPQLVLSLCYVAFNNMMTRLHMTKEWALYSMEYRPLRVTHPKGEQISTYWLQLPLKYSIPMLILSVVLHWAVGNTVFVYVAEGGYFTQALTDATNLGLSDQTFIGLGYSSGPIVGTLVLFGIITFIPLIIAHLELPSETTVPGPNSLAISAACHASPISGVPIDVPLQDLERISHSSQRLMAHQDEVSVDDTRHQRPGPEVLAKLAESKLKWGVVRMNPEFYEEFLEMYTEVEHLSFGAAEDNVQPPVIDRLYT